MTERLSEASEEVLKAADTETVVPFKLSSPASKHPGEEAPDPLQVETNPDKYPQNPRIKKIARLRLMAQGTWGAAADEELRILHVQYVKLRVEEKRSKKNAENLIVSQQHAALRRSLMSKSYRIAAVALMAAAVIVAVL